ncbi:MAG TPA: RNA-binding protein [Dissulfurispiraceae bacterium]
MNILVRNMSRGITEEELFHLFQPFGKVKSLNIVIDASTGNSKGFGFVEMPDDAEAAAAIKALNGKLIQGMQIRVKKTARQNYSPPRDISAGVRPERSGAGKMPSARKGADGRARGSGHKKNTPKGRP